MFVFSVFVRSCSFMCLLIRSPVWVNIQDIFCVYTASLSCAVLHAVAALRHFTVCVQRDRHLRYRHTHSSELYFHLTEPFSLSLTSTAMSMTAGQIAEESKGLGRIKFLSVFRFSWQPVLTRHSLTRFRYLVICLSMVKVRIVFQRCCFWKCFSVHLCQRNMLHKKSSVVYEAVN